MDESKKKTPATKTPDETWVDRLGARTSKTPPGVTSYVGLLRQSPDDASLYQLYQTLDMSSCLHIAKADVVHIDELSADKSPFGSLGGARVFVRRGAKIVSVKTATNTFEAGADDFDLDIRVGRRVPRASSGTLECAATIPDTGCGDACDTIPPFSDPDVGACHTLNTQCGGCTLKCTIDTCGCPPTGLATCKCNPPTHTNCPQTCIITNCGTCETCVTKCGTCQTCATNCGTCQTCATNCGTCHTNCGTCQAHTCATKCGQETCVACTHIYTQCQGRNCQIP